MTRAATLLAFALMPALAGAQRGPVTRVIKEITINDESVTGGLTMIGSVAVGPGGSVYVAQPRDNVVLMFDSAGKFVKKIGGRGQGPGETEGLSSIGFVGDTLWTYDFRGRRFAFFSPDGAYRATLTTTRIIDSSLKAHPMTIQAAAPLANGNLYYGGASYASHAKPILLPPHPLLITTREARVLDTVAFSDSLGRGSFGYEYSGGASFTGDPLFSTLVTKGTMVAVAQNGSSFVVALRGECAQKQRYRVARLSLALDTLWRGTVECPRVPVPAGFVDSIVVVNRNRATSGPRGSAITASYAEAQIRPKLGVVTSFTPARAMMVGSDGSIWIRPMRAIADSTEYWVRADPKPGMPGDFELPPRARLVYVADGSRIWAMQLDENDLPTLTRYRIALPSGDR